MGDDEAIRVLQTPQSASHGPASLQANASSFVRLPWLEPSVWILVAIAVAYQCLCEPFVGTADNRDYWRVMRQIGVAYAEDPEGAVFNNVIRKWTIVAREDVAYLTSQVWLGRVAVWFNLLVSKDGRFDIRAIGFINAAVYLGSVAAYLWAFRRRTLSCRLWIGATALVIFTDVRIVAYFNSFLSESAQVAFMIATIGFALLSLEGAPSSFCRWIYYVSFVVAGVCFCLAKSQDLAFAPALALLAYRLVPSVHSVLQRGGIAVALLFLALPVWAFASGAYAATTGINTRVVVTEEILPHSKHPDRDLKELGDGDVAAVTLTRIVRFYVHHPIRWWRMAKRQGRETQSYLGLGNFEKPLTGVSQAFDGFSNYKRDHYPRKLTRWVLCLLLYGVLLLAKWRRVDRAPVERNRTLLHALLTLACVVQFVVVVTFEANGTVKHFFIFNVLADLLVVFAALDVAAVARYLASLARARWRAPLAAG